MSRMTRRTFLQLAASTAAGSALYGCGAKSGPGRAGNQVNVFSWADYLPPNAIEDFEKRTGLKVVYDTFASNEALLARMEAGAVDYDVIVPTSYALAKLMKMKLLRPIEKDRLSNLKYLMGRFTSLSFDPSGQYYVPYTFGTTGIAYNTSAFDKLALTAPSNWDVFWESKLKGRITLLEDVRETLGFAMKRRGHSYNTTDGATIKEAQRDLIKQKRLMMCYTSDQVIVYLGGGDALLSLAYSGDAHQATKWNKDVTYVLPEAGASLWVDSMCIPASAPHPENAHVWMNYMLEPQVSAALTNHTYFATPNHAALQYIDKAMLADKTLYPPEDMLNRCEQIKDIGDAIFLYDNAWTELKCV